MACPPSLTVTCSTRTVFCSTGLGETAAGGFAQPCVHAPTDWLRALTESILGEAERATAGRSPIKRPFGAALLSWKSAGVAVVTGTAMVLGGELLLNPVRSPSDIGAREANNNPNDLTSPTMPLIQVAMATIANRDLLVEPSDMKLRSAEGRHGTTPSNVNPGKASSETSESVAPRFYDIEVPADLLASWMAGARSGSQIPSAELEPLVGSLQALNPSQNIAVLFDEAIRTRLAPPTPPGVAKQTSATRLRVYDLRDHLADDLLGGISIKTTQKLAPGFFVTLRP